MINPNGKQTPKKTLCNTEKEDDEEGVLLACGGTCLNAEALCLSVKKSQKREKDLVLNEMTLATKKFALRTISDGVRHNFFSSRN